MSQELAEPFYMNICTGVMGKKTPCQKILTESNDMALIGSHVTESPIIGIRK